MRRAFLLLAALVIAGYAAAIGVLAVRETSLVYAGVGRTARSVPDSTAGIPWDTVRVVAADSVPALLLTSRVDAAPDRPWAVYLHGNFGNLGARGNVARYVLLRDAGFNVLAVEYRGFGASASAGTPSEPGIYADANAGWTHLTQTLGVAPGRVLIYGLSLGGGPAAYLAHEHAAGALVTEGSATMLPDVGAEQYPWVPVKLVMRNRYPTITRAPAITEPWVIFHGRPDDVIPFSHGEALAAAAPNARLVPLNTDHDGGVVDGRATSLPVLREMFLRLSTATRD
jgi:pimeloyl-ACP methyl ester carboxylesterase